MISAKKLKILPSPPPLQSKTIRFHSNPPAHVVQRTFINELQRTTYSSLERRSFGSTLIERSMCLSNNFLPDKARNIYKYLMYIKPTGKREYIRQEMKGCRTSCVFIIELRIKQVSSRKCNR